jgi:hypothetical protein
MVSQSPSTLGIGTDIKWTVPAEIAARTDIDSVRIWRSNVENANYTELDQILYSQSSSCYNDPTGSRGLFYLVTFVSSLAPFESPWHITFFPPLPYEAKLIEQIRRATPEVIARTMTDEDFLNGLNLAVQIFNTYPPETSFSLSSFPRSHQAYLIGLAQLTALTSRFLPISIRDWTYSEPGGTAMNIDRGAKINAAMEIITKVYTQYLPLIKLDFAWDSPMGVGTVQLPLSMGGAVSRGLLNVLDIFTATGR